MKIDVTDLTEMQGAAILHEMDTRGYLYNVDYEPLFSGAYNTVGVRFDGEREGRTECAGIVAAQAIHRATTGRSL